MREIGLTLLLLTLGNVFMTFAWYAHLKELGSKPWFVAALLSWGIAFFEYMLQVPANRIGYTVLSLGQLKILQEVVTLVVFVPFAVFYMKEPLKLDYLGGRLHSGERQPCQGQHPCKLGHDDRPEQCRMSGAVDLDQRRVPEKTTGPDRHGGDRCERHRRQRADNRFQDGSHGITAGGLPAESPGFLAGSRPAQATQHR